MRLPTILLAGLLSLAACSSNDATTDSPSTNAAEGSSTTATPTAPPATTSAAAEPLRILVTNDDGYASTGIDTLVEALGKLPEVEVTVVAPATNQSGTGERRSEEPVTASAVETASGAPATAVAGTPADSVVYALDEVFTEAPPDLVVSGSNEGQNLGVITDVSGTVGAARTAARRGIPALAVSQGLGAEPDYPASVEAAIAWITEHRDEILAFDGATAEVWSINAPTCAKGEPRGVLEIATATEATGDEVVADVDCTVSNENPAHDVEAFTWGYVTLSNVGLD